MPSAKNPSNATGALYVDMGTTNTRVWLVRREKILIKRQIAVGARDTARGGSSAPLRAALRDLLAEVQAAATGACRPAGVIAAGMITSPLGLMEIPHVQAPAGPMELAAAVQRHYFPDVTDLPVWLVPGVRVGPDRYTGDTVGMADVMRGEETLCVGLHAGGRLEPGATLLNLGSHWKAIGLDAQGRIASSVTSLAGELIHAAQTQTILASAVPPEWPDTFDAAWVEAGMQEQRRSGLARALFCVRLLEQRSETAPAERFAFLAGAFIASELDALTARGKLAAGCTVAIAGGGPLAEAWKRALTRVSVPAVTLSSHEVDQAWLSGLQRVMALANIG